MKQIERVSGSERVKTISVINVNEQNLTRFEKFSLSHRSALSVTFCSAASGRTFHFAFICRYFYQRITTNQNVSHFHFACIGVFGLVSISRQHLHGAETTLVVVFIRRAWANKCTNRRYDLFTFWFQLFSVWQKEFCNLKRYNFCLLCVCVCSVCQIQIGIWAPASTIRIYKTWRMATGDLNVGAYARLRAIDRFQSALFAFVAIIHFHNKWNARAKSFVRFVKWQELNWYL